MSTDTSRQMCCIIQLSNKQLTVFCSVYKNAQILDEDDKKKKSK